MKIRRILLVGGTAVIAVAAAYFGLSFCFSPIAVVTNAGDTAVNVHLESDVGESTAVGTIEAGGSAKLRISGRDKLLWVVAMFPDGRVLQSQKLYTTSQGIVYASVSTNSVDISYEL